MNQKSRLTDLVEFFGEMNGGAFQEQMQQAINQTALAVCENGRKGKIKIEIDFKKISRLNQVDIDACLTYQKPTLRGKVTEVITINTPMYVGKGGKVTIFQEDQSDMFNEKKDDAKA